MQYENRLPPEGINISRVHPLKQFAQLLVAALILIVVLFFILQASGAFLAKRIPFAFEVSVMQKLNLSFGDEKSHPEMTAYLNTLADKISRNMSLPEGMSMKVHYSNTDEFNAFATVGGNLLFYRELLASMPNENTLAMVMAHELSHVLHRDPVASLGGGIASMFALLALTGNAGTKAAGSVLGGAGMLTSIQFTRKMEEQADTEALHALQATYGHVQGSSELFEIFTGSAEDVAPDVQSKFEMFFSTHPSDDQRRLRMLELSQQQGWALEGELTPLPEGFKHWLQP